MAAGKTMTAEINADLFDLIDQTVFPIPGKIEVIGGVVRVCVTSREAAAIEGGVISAAQSGLIDASQMLQVQKAFIAARDALMRATK